MYLWCIFFAQTYHSCYIFSTCPSIYASMHLCTKLLYLAICVAHIATMTHEVCSPQPPGRCRGGRQVSAEVEDAEWRWEGQEEGRGWNSGSNYADGFWGGIIHKMLFLIWHWHAFAYSIFSSWNFPLSYPILTKNWLLILRGSDD